MAIVDLSTLDGTNGFRLAGAAAGDFSGFSVSGAGDVNGDGFDDVIVGAFDADANGTSSGASYVVFGASFGIPASVDLSALDGATGFRISGAAAGDVSGRSVSAAGDVNGDGFADLIIGANNADPNGISSGASYVVFGKDSGLAADINLSTLDGTNGFRIAGLAAYDQSGFSVSGAGDVNGDGIDDLVVGAWGADPATNRLGAGITYVVFGTSSGFAANFDLLTLNGTNGFKLSGEAAADNSGIAVSAAGDVNGDNIDDLIIGASGADSGGTSSGTSYVVFGKNTDFTANVNLSSLNGTTGFKIAGVASGDFSGYAVSGAGDVNGDGFDDVIVGASAASPNGGGSGASYVVFGKASGFTATFNLSALDGSNGFRIAGAAAGDFSGVSVSAAGDVNGDGFDDLIVGAPYADVSGSDSGASYLLYGKGSGFAATMELAAIADADGFTILGAAGLDRLGRAVRAAGDVNGDEIDDLIVGAPSADANGSNSGASYVVFGSLPGDTIGGTENPDTLVGGDGSDTIVAGAGDDTVDGGAGNDSIDGGDGNDTLDGGTGNDALDGGAGVDLLKGGTGNDVYYVDDVNDMVEETSNSPSELFDLTSALPAASVLSGFVDTVIAAVNYSLENVAFVENMVLSAVAASGTGNALDNVLVGNASDNVLAGLEGNDTLTGGGGIDTAVFEENRASYTIAPSGTGYTVSTFGDTDKLFGIERLEFADKNIALDLGPGGSAGNTARVIGAAFDAPTIQQHPDYVGIGLALFDSGMSVLEVCQLVIAVLGNPSDESFVTTVYQNLVGAPPSPEELNFYVGLLQGSGGPYSQAQLLEIAVNSPVNAENINLVGLQQSGVEFV